MCIVCECIYLQRTTMCTLFITYINITLMMSNFGLSCNQAYLVIQFVERYSPWCRYDMQMFSALLFFTWRINSWYNSLTMNHWCRAFTFSLIWVCERAVEKQWGFRRSEMPPRFFDVTVRHMEFARKSQPLTIQTCRHSFSSSFGIKRIDYMMHMYKHFK